MVALKGRIVLVTGASRGIGYEAALKFAREGAHIIAVARTVGGLEALDDAIRDEGGSTTLVPMDLKDGAAIDRLGAAINQRWQRLDILLANGAMLGPLTPIGHLDPEKFDEVIAVNLTANWRLIRSLDPLLKASDRGRAIFMTSGAAHKCRPFWGAYSVSKAGLEALARTYAGECANSTICVNLVNPGATRTRMRAEAIPGEDPESLPHPREVATLLLQLVKPENTQNGMIFDVPSRSWSKLGQL